MLSSPCALARARAFVAGIGYDYAMNAIWDMKNKGVRAALDAPARLAPPPLTPPLWSLLSHTIAEAMEGYQEQLR